MAVMGAVVAHKQLGIYVYGCGIKQENGFCAAGITVPSGVLFQTAQSCPRTVQRACEESPGFSPLIHEVCCTCLEVRLFSV